jgi:hypothetical protein
MSHDDALQLISRELLCWGYSMTRLPKYLTLEQALRIVGAT